MHNKVPLKVPLIGLITLLLALCLAPEIPVNAATNGRTKASMDCNGFVLQYDFTVDRNNVGTPASEHILFRGLDGAGTVIFSREATYSLASNTHRQGLIVSLWTRLPRVDPLTLQIVSTAGNSQPEQVVFSKTVKCRRLPTTTPTAIPTSTPTEVPSSTPTTEPTSTPTDVPTSTPTEVPSSTPTSTTIPADLAVTVTHDGNYGFVVGMQSSLFVTISQIGPQEPVYPLTIVDTLPDDVTINGFYSQTGFTCTNAGQTITCTTTNRVVTPDQQIDLVINVIPTVVGTFTNTATVSDANGDSNPGDNTAVNSFSVVPAPDIVVTTAHGDYVQGQIVTLPITITNIGQGATVGPIELIDYLPSIVDYVSASGQGWTCDVYGFVECSYPQPLAPGEQTTVEILINTTVPGNAGNNVEGFTFGDPDHANNAVQDTIVIVVGTGTPTATNTDEPTATPTATDTSTPSPTWTPTATRTTSPTPTATWTRTPTRTPTLTLTPSRTRTLTPTFTPSLTLTPSATRTASSTPTATWTRTPTRTPTTVPTNTLTPTTILSDLAVTVNHAGQSDFVMSMESVVVVTISQIGTQEPVYPITIVETLPDNMTINGFYSQTGFDCTNSGQTITCTTMNRVVTPTEPNDLIIYVIPTAVGTLTNTATVSDANGDSNPGNNTAVNSFSVVPAPDIAVTIAHGEFVSGQTVTLPITITNVGQGTTIDTIHLTEYLPSIIEYVSTSSAGWTCNVTNVTSLVSCRFSQPLASGEQTILELVINTAAIGNAGNLIEAYTYGDPDSSNDTVQDTIVVVAGTDTPTPINTDDPLVTFTPTPTNTDGPTPTETNTPSPTWTNTPTATFTRTATRTPSPTFTPTSTRTPTPMIVITPSATRTATPTPTATWTRTPTRTPTPTVIPPTPTWTSTPITPTGISPTPVPSLIPTVILPTPEPSQIPTDITPTPTLTNEEQLTSTSTPG